MNRFEWHAVPTRARHLIRYVKALATFVMAQPFVCQCSPLCWHSVAQSEPCHAKNLKILVWLDSERGTICHSVPAKDYKLMF